MTSPPQTPLPSPAPTSIKAGDIVATLVDDLRVRSKPRVTDSVKYEPLLPAGTKLYVLDGPVEGSGYEWFWVAQLSAPELPSGWVARAGRDGEAWLGTSTFDCPVAPDDFLALLGLPRGVGLACFSRTPITFNARLFELNGDPTPGSDWITPNWLFSVGGGPAITDPSASGPYWVDPCCGLEHPYLELLVDPDGTYPARLPIGRYVGGITWTLPHVVRITGMFDHPAAQACRWDSHDENPDVALPLDPAVGTCRLEFAVTSIVVP